MRGRWIRNHALLAAGSSTGARDELRRLRRASCPCSANLDRVWRIYARVDHNSLGLVRYVRMLC